jgi:flagella basal body P-ring formation protein FlgA
VARLISSGLHLDPRDLQLVIDRRDEALWLTASSTSRFEIDPLSGLRSDRIELAVRTWTDGTVQSRTTLTVRPLIQIRAATMRTDVNRGERLGEEHLTAQTLWLPPSQAEGTIPPDEATGRTTTRRLHTGDLVRQQHVRSEYVIERGDRTMVRCLVGGVVITLQAEAQADGARGDSIEFRKLGERQTFVAVVAAPGEAVVDLSR